MDNVDTRDIVPMVRVCTQIGGINNCYISLGHGICDVKFPEVVPYEKREMEKIAEEICAAVKRGMERLVETGVIKPEFAAAGIPKPEPIKYNPGRRKSGAWGNLGLSPRKDISELAQPTAHDKKYTP